MPEELQQKDWALLPYNIERINGEYLLSNYFGSWDILTKKELRDIIGYDALDKEEEMEGQQANDQEPQNQ